MGTKVSKVVALTAPIAMMLSVIPMISPVFAGKAGASVATCNMNSRISAPAGLGMDCSPGGPNSLVLSNDQPQFSALVMTLNLTGDTSAGSITPLPGASVYSQAMYEIGPAGTIPPGYQETVAFGSGSGGITTEVASESTQLRWELVNLVGGLLPVDVLGDAQALRSAFDAYSVEVTHYSACLGPRPSFGKKILCGAKLVEEAGLTSLKLEVDEGIQFAPSKLREIGPALEGVADDVFAIGQANEVVQFRLKTSHQISILPALTGSKWTLEVEVPFPAGPTQYSCEIDTLSTSGAFLADLYGDRGTWSSSGSTLTMSFTAGEENPFTFTGTFTTTPTPEYSGSLGASQPAQLVEGAVPTFEGKAC